MDTAILWFRRDLRLGEHPALAASLARADRLVPCFCLDHRLINGRFASERRHRFLLDCLGDLDRTLRERGSRLTVLDGRPEEALPTLCRTLGASSVHASRDVGPFADRRDRGVEVALARDGVELALHPGVFVVDDPRTLQTRAGGPYTVFTPFHRTWAAAPRRPVRAAPDALPPHPAEPDLPPVLRTASPGVRDGVGARAAGETAAQAALEAFLRDGVDEYSARRNILADATSRLSAHLHFGSISARQVEAALPEGDGAQEFRRQLCWRDFYAHVLAAFPDNTRLEHQQRLRARSAGGTPTSCSTHGARDARDIRSSTRRCASCRSRAGCTTGRG